MDYMNLGSIRDVMDTLEKPLSEMEAIEVVKTTLIGLIYLHLLLQSVDDQRSQLLWTPRLEYGWVVYEFN